MAVVERYYWEPNDLEEFLSLHREIHDQHLRKAGASDMNPLAGSLKLEVVCCGGMV